MSGAAVAIVVATALNLAGLQGAARDRDKLRHDLETMSSQLTKFQPQLEGSAAGARLLLCTLEVSLRDDLEEAARSRLFRDRCGVEPAR